MKQDQKNIESKEVCVWSEMKYVEMGYQYNRNAAFCYWRANLRLS
jgi:hypothetical protein